jgi:hypothetical protein
MTSNNEITASPLVGVLALQGAFEEHQASLEASGCRTRQVRKLMCFVMEHSIDCWTLCVVLNISRGE